MELDYQRPAGQVEVKVITGSQNQEALERLLNRCFPVLPGTSFFDDFPIWDERNGAEIHRVGVFTESGHVAASACIRMGWLKSSTSGKEVWVALLGAVATHPKWRGKGLASRAIAQVCQDAEKFGAAAIFLFGTEYDLYRKQGFDVAGEQAHVPLSGIRWGDIKSIPYVEGWNSELVKLLSDRPLGLRISAADGAWISAHKNIRWLWTGPIAEPTAYLAIGKGIDLGGMIHEWGGEPTALRGLIATLSMKEPKLELLCPPEFAEILGARVIRESLCMAKPLKKDFEIPEDLWLWGLDGV